MNPGVTIESRSSALTWGAMIAVALTIAVFSRVAFLSDPFPSDGAMFIYMGKLVADGARFGEDIVDNKFATVGLFMSLPWRALGAWWGGYVLLQACLGVLSSVVIARAAHRSFGNAAAVPALIAALVLVNFHPVVFGGFQLETVIILFTSLAAMSAMETLRHGDPRDAYLAGLAAAVACMLKPTGVAVIVALAVAMVTARRSTRIDPGRCALAVALGAATPAVAGFRYLLESDSLSSVIQTLGQLRDYSSSSTLDAIDLLKPAIAAGCVLFPVIVRGFVFRRHRAEGKGSSAIATFVILWLVLELLGIVLQRRMYAYHFLVLAPPSALLYALLPRLARVREICASWSPLAALSLVAGWMTFSAPIPRPQEVYAVQYLAARTLPGERVWRDNGMRIHIETTLRAGCRVPISFLWVNSDDAALQFATSMLSDFQENRPTYIVLPSELDLHISHRRSGIAELAQFPARGENYSRAWQLIQHYAHEHYELEHVHGGEAFFRRRSSPADVAASLRD